MAEVVLLAPMAGWALPIEETPDPVFAERMLGDGVAIDPTGQSLHAPCAGEVLGINRARHAVTLRSAEGVEILMHVGLETVALEGRGFEAHVREGQAVAAGDLLLSFDLDILARGAKSLVSPVVVTNGERFRIVSARRGSTVAVGEPLMTLEPIEAESAAAPAADAGLAKRSIIVPLAHGIHARPAATIAAAAKRFSAQARVSGGGKSAKAISPMALMALGVRRGDEITIDASGPDAEMAVAALADLILHGIAEEPAAATGPPARRDPVPASVGPRLTGVAAAPGIAIGVAARLAAPEIVVEDQASDPDAEGGRLAEALAKVRAHLEALAASGSKQQRSVLGAHLAFLEDPELVQAAHDLIGQGMAAGRAWKRAVDGYVALVRAAGDPRIAERVDDLVDLQRQVLLALSGKTHQSSPLPEGAILLAEDLLPSQLIGLDPARLAGVCIARGGPTSHVAILAASMNIPALVAVGPAVMNIPDGARLILDADSGVLDAAPDEGALEAAERAMEAGRRRRQAARGSADEPCRMADGRRIEVLANLGSVADARAAVAAGAEGCGLLRTEFLFLDRETAPDEDEQLTCYQAIADILGDRPLTIRTLDVGGDKPVAYLPIAAEDNPALGLRGVRVSLARPDLLRTQLRAILKVRARGPLRIMAPMVASRSELAAVRAMIAEIRVDLGTAAPIEFGAMVETPAAAIAADVLCGEAEFVSLGTNDLAQYTLAMDRGNPAVAAAVDGLHPGVLRMIAAAVDGATSKGRSTSVCGGLASDFTAVPILIGLGVHSLSALPAMAPELKDLIRSLTEAECVRLAEEALDLASAVEVRALAASLARRQTPGRGPA
jgi:phosphocarrier protein FPr/phosphocarrier protein